MDAGESQSDEMHDSGRDDVECGGQSRAGLLASLLAGRPIEANVQLNAMAEFGRNVATSLPQMVGEGVLDLVLFQDCPAHELVAKEAVCASGVLEGVGSMAFLQLVIRKTFEFGDGDLVYNETGPLG